MFQLLGAAYLAVFSIPLIVIDIRERRLPNKITLPGIAVTLLGLGLAGDWLRFGIAVGLACLVFLVGTLVSMRGWLGMGDVKLLVSIALMLGWYGPLNLLLGLSGAFLVAGAVVLVKMALKKITASSTIALGPYLLAGFWVAVTQPVWSSIAR